MRTTHNRAGNESENSSSTKREFQRHPQIGRIAERLQQKAERMSSNKKWLGLILFCLLSIGCSVGVILYSIQTHSPFFSVEPIRVPVSLANPHYLPRLKDSLVKAAQYERIRRIESYLSQQKNNHLTRIFYDSLLESRPHFLDSLRAIDSLFVSQ